MPWNIENHKPKGWQAVAARSSEAGGPRQSGRNVRCPVSVAAGFPERVPRRFVIRESPDESSRAGKPAASLTCLRHILLHRWDQEIFCPGWALAKRDFTKEPGQITGQTDS